MLYIAYYDGVNLRGYNNKSYTPVHGFGRQRANSTKNLRDLAAKKAAEGVKIIRLTQTEFETEEEATGFGYSLSL